MSIITKVLKQTAVYWAMNDSNEFGQPEYDNPIELSVRWDKGVKEVIASDGVTVFSTGNVMVSSSVVVGGVMMFGSIPDITDDTRPLNNDGAYEIIAIEETPNFKCTETLRIAYLR